MPRGNPSRLLAASHLHTQTARPAARVSNCPPAVACAEQLRRRTHYSFEAIMCLIPCLPGWEALCLLRRQQSGHIGWCLLIISSTRTCPTGCALPPIVLCSAARRGRRRAARHRPHSSTLNTDVRSHYPAMHLCLPASQYRMQGRMTRHTHTVRQTRIKQKHARCWRTLGFPLRASWALCLPRSTLHTHARLLKEARDVSAMVPLFVCEDVRNCACECVRGRGCMPVRVHPQHTPRPAGVCRPRSLSSRCDCDHD
jgi:hypothetical protein